MKLPEKGLAPDELFARMRERKREDADWRGGRTWSLIYPAGDDIDEVLREANLLYLYENALNPFRFPSLKDMEAEVVSMTASILGGGGASGGTMTSGGTESILMAVKTARERARDERGVDRPQLLAPESAHPAFAKAAHYLGLEHVRIPLGADLRADLGAAESLMTERTALVVGSAPNYPHGVIDPIEELAALAVSRGVSFHTDACVGGFLLPFLQRLGHEVPAFDLSVPGVTTISADVHKYGYATKGASVLLHADSSTLRHQIFLYDQWPGGLYGSPAMAGARAAAPVAAAWAVMNYLGFEGYTERTRSLLDTANRLRSGIEAVEGLTIWGDPAATVMSFGSRDFDIMAVGDLMDEHGWHLDRQNGPDALHMMISPEHSRIVEEFLTDLDAAAGKVRSGGVAAGDKAARYN